MSDTDSEKTTKGLFGIKPVLGPLMLIVAHKINQVYPTCWQEERQKLPRLLDWCVYINYSDGAIQSIAKSRLY